MAEGSQVLFVNTRTGEALPAIESIGTASITFDQLPVSATSAFVKKSGDTMTGTLTVPLLIVLAQNASAEGGEFRLAIPTSSSLSGTNVNFDMFINQFRIFEDSGSNRGANLDLSTLASSVGSRILTSPEDAPGLVLLTSGTVTNAATLDIVLTAYTSYRAIEFLLSNFVPVTDDVELWMRTSTNGGSSYDSGASDYAYAARGLFNNVTSADIGSTGAAQIVLAGFNLATFAVSNVTNEAGVDAKITLHNQTRAAFGRVLYNSGFAAAVLTNSNDVVQNGTGSRLAAADIDAVRFLFESGNISSGNYAVYGYR